MVQVPRCLLQPSKQRKEAIIYSTKINTTAHALRRTDAAPDKQREQPGLTDFRAAVIWSCTTLIHVILSVGREHGLVWRIQQVGVLKDPGGNEAYMGPNVSDCIMSQTGYQIDSFNGMQRAAQTRSQSITPPHVPKLSFITGFLSNLAVCLHLTLR